MKLLNQLKLSPAQLLLLCLSLICGLAMADKPQAIALSTIAGNIDKTVVSLAQILTDIALIAGIAFILASFFKFHQHKLNPTQVPISQGVTLLLIGTALTLFVVLLPTASQAVFGKDAQTTKVGGNEISTLIGGSQSGG